VGSRPSPNSTTATATESLSLPPTAHWFPYEEDEFGDSFEPPERVPLSESHRANRARVDCGCVPLYGLAA